MSYTLLPDIHLFLNKAARDFFSFSMDEKKLGGSYVQADIVDQLGFSLAGEIVFDEKRQAFSSNLGEKGNLLLVTPIQLFDESMENAPSTSFASPDGLFVSKSDLFEHLKMGKEKTRLWLLEGAKACAQSFIEQNLAQPQPTSQQTFSHLPPTTSSSWRIASWEEFVAVFPNDREILRRHLSSCSTKILTRLLAATSKNSPLNQQLQKIKTSPVSDPDVFPSVRDSLGNYLSCDWLNQFKQALHNPNVPSNEAFLKQSMSSFSLEVGATGSLFAASVMGLFGKVMSAMNEQEGEKRHLVAPKTIEQMGSTFSSTPQCTPALRELFARCASGYAGLDPLPKEVQNKNEDFSFLATMFSLSDNGTLSKNVLLSDISVKKMSSTFDHLFSCAKLNWLGLVMLPAFKSTDAIEKTISLLTDKNMEALSFSDFQEIGKFSLKAIVDHKEQVLSLYEKEINLSEYHPLVGLLTWHRPSSSSPKDVASLFDMFLTNPPLCNNETVKANTLFQIALLAIREKDPQYEFSKAILSQVSQNLNTLVDRKDFSPSKTTWKLMEELACSQFAFPDFQHELSLKMKERGLLDIEGNQKNHWITVSELLKSNNNSDIQLAFKQTLNLLEKDELLSHVSLSLKNKKDMSQQATSKKLKM